MTSAILTKLAETYPEVLTNPESILGPNALKVLEFWEHIEGLSDLEKKEISDLYLALDDDVRVSAIDAACDVANDVVGWEFKYAAWRTAYDVTGARVFGYATLELVGNVNNKVAYNLIMSHKNL